MLRSIRDLEKYSIHATDGDIGHVKDFYFDDSTWVIRYLIVDTSAWLPNRKVLISPISMGQPDWAKKMLSVKITKEQVKGSPDIDTDKPVSRQHEMRYLCYYGYPYYWSGAGLWGESAYPYAILKGGGRVNFDGLYGEQGALDERELWVEGKNAPDDPHLRSSKEVVGYHIDAIDGDIGHVHDLLVDERTWAIRYIVVNTSNWFGNHQVLIVPQWIRGISWSEHMLSVNLSRQQVKEAPLYVYDSAEQLDREHEEGIYRHYGRKGYWKSVPKHQPRSP